MKRLIFFLLLLLEATLSQRCPSMPTTETICNATTNGVQWISNLTDASGPGNGSSYEVRWMRDPLMPNISYVVFYRQIFSDGSGGRLEGGQNPTQHNSGFIQELMQNTYYDAMVCREELFTPINLNALTPGCGFCRFCFRSGNASDISESIFLPTYGVIIFVVGVAVLLGIILVASVIGAICFVKKRRIHHKLIEIRKSPQTENKDMMNKELLIEESSLSNMPEIFRSLPKSLIIDVNKIEVGHVIGQGEFGVVYRGSLKLQMNETVAIKTLKGIFATSNDVENLSKEIEKMLQFDHPNVMSLIGVCAVPSGQTASTGLCMVMPFMAKGSLLDQLRKHSEKLTMTNEDDKSFTTVKKQLAENCYQIAKGMEYLANLRFVHRDLAARNCLIDMYDVIKVSDFGLAEDIYSQNYFRQVKGSTKLPLKWMSPESITQGRFTEKSDVWSYGVTCWEVYTGGSIPYPGLHPREIPEYLDDGERLKKPKNAACDPEIFSMMQSCWEQKDSSRPTFSEIVLFLESHLEYTSDYLDLTGEKKESPTLLNVQINKTFNSREDLSAVSEHDSLPRVPASSNDYYIAS